MDSPTQLVALPIRRGRRSKKDLPLMKVSPQRPHQCPECSKAFPNSGQLGQHLVVHTGVRKYKCGYCGKAFKQLSHLQQHQRTHTGELPYKCTIEGCSRAFAQLANLKHHMHAVLHSGESSTASATYNCNICDQLFSSQVSLEKHHQKTHLEEMKPIEPIKCDVCKEVFKSPKLLNKHVVSVHKNIQCSVCGKNFSRRSFMLRHMRMKWDNEHIFASRALSSETEQSIKTEVIDTECLTIQALNDPSQSEYSSSTPTTSGDDDLSEPNDESKPAVVLAQPIVSQRSSNSELNDESKPKVIIAPPIVSSDESNTSGDSVLQRPSSSEHVTPQKTFAVYPPTTLAESFAHYIKMSNRQKLLEDRMTENTDKKN